MSDDQHEKSKDWQAVADEASKMADQETQEPSNEKVGIEAALLEHPSYQALEEQLTKTEQKLDKAIRTVAELENERRHWQRSNKMLQEYGSQKSIEEFFPVMDSLEQAIQACANGPIKDQALVDGIKLTLEQFYSVFEKFSAKIIDPIGQVFDPHLHEAISIIEDESKPVNTVVAVVQKGCQLHERVIRPARVVVTKIPTAKA